MRKSGRERVKGKLVNEVYILRDSVKGPTTDLGIAQMPMDTKASSLEGYIYILIDRIEGCT